MVRSKEELINEVSEIIGENTDDKALALLEDVTDTLDSLSVEDTENWKEKFEELDKAWREKYKARFLNKEEKPDELPEEVEEKTKFEELFEEKEK